MSKNDGWKFLNIKRLSLWRLGEAEAEVVSWGKSFHLSRRPSSRRGRFEKSQSSVSVSAGLWERLIAPLVVLLDTLSGILVASGNDLLILEFLPI